MSLFRRIKNKLYFVVASYFGFFASLYLRRWQPRIVVVTGSNGKTSTLHLLKSQLQDRAVYSEKANSTYGIPFHILGLQRKTFKAYEWLFLFALAPFKVFRQKDKHKIYVVEADSDRPGEGYFLSKLLKPEVTIWLSSERTHSQNYDASVQSKKFADVDTAIAHAFGSFLRNTSSLSIINGDSDLIKNESKDIRSEIVKISGKHLQEYQVTRDGTKFMFDGLAIDFQALLPQKFFYSVLAVVELVRYFGFEPDYSFSGFELPPGRSSVLKGIKNSTIIDSSYNANYAQLSTILAMFDQMPGTNKWLVLGDLIEQGAEEKEEHEKVARLIDEYHFTKVILVGPRLQKYALPKLNLKTESFLEPKDALSYIEDNLSGGEMLLFKGARFLEGIVEHLLLNKNDVNKLCRREEVWQNRRKKWGL